jgi:tetratricopeptide (TPR) repeat protein
VPSERSRPSRGASRSVAILPFVDMSAERDQDYFCDGIAEEIINALCCVRELKVASRTSAFQFKGRSNDVREIGACSVWFGARRQRSQIRRSAADRGAARRHGRRLSPLVRDVRPAARGRVRDPDRDCAADHAHAAHEPRRREAAQVERGGTTSSDAYEYYLRGRALLRKHGAARLHRDRCFRRAIEIDPNFALGHAGLAAAIADNAFWRQDQDEDELAEAMRSVARADELQPGLVEVMVRADSCSRRSADPRERPTSFEAAVERAPSYPETYYWYARHAFTLGDHAKAARLFERAIEFEPTNYTAWGLLGQSYEVLGSAIARATLIGIASS